MKNLFDPSKSQDANAALDEKIFRLLEQSLDPICCIDRKGLFVTVSQSCEKILGYANTELAGTCFSEIILAEDEARSRAVAGKLMSGEDLVNFENRYLHKNGSVVHLVWLATWDADEQMMYCVARDMTAMHKARTELERSHERFYFATKATYDAVWEWELKDDHLTWGENYGLLFGHDTTDGKQSLSNWYNNIHPDDRKAIVDSIYRATSDGSNVWTAEYRYRNADGRYCWVNDRGVVLRDRNGEALRMIGAMQDVTKRKEAENKLQEREQRFHSLVQTSSDMIGVMDKDGNYLYASASVERILGYQPEFFSGRNAFEFIHPEDLVHTLSGMERIANEKEIRLEPFRFKNAMGEWRWMETWLSNQLDNPTIGGIVSNTRDITEKKQLIDEMQIMSTLAQQTVNPVVLTDMKRERIIWVNKAYETLYGFTLGEVKGKNPYSILYGSDTTAEITERIKADVAQLQVVEEEVMLYTKDKKKRLVNVLLQPIYDDRGKALYYFSIHHDITDKRKLEQKLARQRKERQRGITKAVIVAQEKERMQIGRELHDNVNQLLATVKLYLEMSVHDDGARAQLLPKSVDFVNQAINQIRNLSHALAFSLIPGQTLSDALEELVHSIHIASPTEFFSATK